MSQNTCDFLPSKLLPVAALLTARSRQTNTGSCAVDLETFETVNIFSFTNHPSHSDLPRAEIPPLEGLSSGAYKFCVPYIFMDERV